MKKLSLFFIGLLCFGQAWTQMQSPDQFLGYTLGDRFTPHHQVVAYFKHLESQQQIKLTEYGKTSELRPLLLAFVSTPENLKNLEQIRTDNLKRAGLLPGTPSDKKIAMVWLSYNVHGNESVSTEVAMQTAYRLLNDADKKAWLENTVVVIDPCLNPDGRDRYVEWYNRVANKRFNPDPNSTEHYEPWPGGRANHYLFDLNRDWAWLTQIESQQRMAVYHQYMPHVHADLHEQSVNSPYYFAPAAEPLHEQISNWQRQFQKEIGKNHAKYFDKEGWLYFTGEYFDLFYPSYGDTYPMFSGAIGMTYEQGGSGRAGLGITTFEGDILTLKDRISHHYITSISTVEVTSKNASKVVDEFQAFFKNTAANPKGKYKSYVIKADNHPDKIKELTQWLDLLQIQYGTATVAKAAKGFNYQKAIEENFTISTNDIVITAYQPKSVLVQVLFEPKSALPDSLSYDITAWSAPYAQGLNAFAVNEKLGFNTSKPLIEQKKIPDTAKPYAYLIEWGTHQDARFLAALIQKGIKARYANNPFELNGKKFGRGTLIITRRGNEHLGDAFDTDVRALAMNQERTLHTATTGFVDSGNDFGSEQVRYIKAPKVALVGGDRTSSLSFGEVWFFFDQELDYPVSVLNTSYLNRIDLSDYDVLILPDGYYSSIINEGLQKSIIDWVQKGGRLILIEGAIYSFENKDNTEVAKYANDEEKKKAEARQKAWEERDRLRFYHQRERESIQNFVGGSIFKLRMDTSHPLAFGYSDNYYTLKTNSDRFAYLKTGWNVGTYSGKQAQVSGFVGSRVSQELQDGLVYGVEDKGRGQIIYMADTPLFRGFWKNGRLLMSNAVFFVGQ